jgi:hypothetical protein
MLKPLVMNHSKTGNTLRISEMIAQTRPAIVAVLLALRTFSISASLAAEDWPQWRGPSSLGISSESGLPTSWGPGTNIAWKVSLAGFGASSPIVWGDRIYVTSQVGKATVRKGSHPLLARDDPVLAGQERIMDGPRMESVAAGPQQPGEGGDDMDEKDEEMAHLRSIAKTGFD